MLKRNIPVLKTVFRTMSSEWGSGSGKGGGSGGSIRESGGSFGKMESAREEEFFRKQQKEQIENIKGHLSEEISHHEELIKQHQDAINRSKKQIEDLNKK